MSRRVIPELVTSFLHRRHHRVLSLQIHAMYQLVDLLLSEPRHVCFSVDVGKRILTCVMAALEGDEGGGLGTPPTGKFFFPSFPQNKKGRERVYFLHLLLLFCFCFVLFLFCYFLYSIGV